MRAPLHLSRPSLVLAAIAAMALTACNPQDNPSAMAGQPRGASVAFESIEGPPPGQFRQLVQSLNTEAQSRQLAVMSRDSASAYRVRGYLAAKMAKRETTISWVWDVFDRDDHRALRITGEETAKGAHRDAWSAADDAMLERIARNSMDQLAAFLTSPEAAPGTPDAEPQQVAFGLSHATPEAAGIYRMSQPNADPALGEAAEPAIVPLPPKRPPLEATVVSARETLMLAASGY
ncbi:MAG TPA: hypothetical protein VGF02_13275 [Pseudolabrys sp.]|jgi:hypothetical protein